MTITPSDGTALARPVDELLARASAIEAVQPSDGKSGSQFARVSIAGEQFFLKRVSPASDWIMRVTRDRVHRGHLIWQAGVMDAAPPCIDHTVVAMQLDGDGDAAVLSTLMRDVGAWLVPEGDAVVPAAQHRGFVEHLAEMCAAFWGWRDSIGGLSTMTERVRYFAPDNIAPELRVESVPATLAAADRGWGLLPQRAPLLWRLASAVHADPSLLTEPLASLPVTFLHGDWKMGNLGTHANGRTILLDWAYPGSGPACWDLWWYVALNRVRLPESKEATVARFRAALELQGIATGEWWQAQLDLCLLAIMATFGWEKALDDAEELSWWERGAAEALQRQGLSV
jgi:phosphotransferase family enzyme